MSRHCGLNDSSSDISPTLPYPGLFCSTPTVCLYATYSRRLCFCAYGKREDTRIHSADHRGELFTPSTDYEYSGKTFQILASRIVTRLRALIVLPTKDLVAQVREVFEVLGKGRRLKV